MGTDFPALKALGIEVRNCDNAKDSCEVVIGDVGKTVTRATLAAAEASLAKITGATANPLKASAGRFGTAKEKSTEGAVNFGTWFVKKFTPAVGPAVASAVLGEYLKPSIDARIEDNKGVK